MPSVSERKPLPSRRTMKTRLVWRGKKLLGGQSGLGESRSEENAIHSPSGDHAGRKSPPGWLVRLRSFRDAISRIHTSACPPRSDTKARYFPSGEKAA